MKIKIGINDSLRKETVDGEISFVSLLEDDQYFNRKVRELRDYFKKIISERNGVRMSSCFVYPEELVDLDKYSNGDKYLEKVGKFCFKYKNCPFEIMFSVRSLIENNYWIPISNWKFDPINIIKGKDIEIDPFNEGDIFIQISKDIGITKLKKYLDEEYKKISDYFKKIDPYIWKLKGVNQENLEINKKVFHLHMKRPKLKWNEIAEIINGENKRAHCTDKTINNLYKDYLRSIRNLRK